MPCWGSHVFLAPTLPATSSPALLKVKGDLIPEAAAKEIKASEAGLSNRNDFLH
jgi:hypothetical protein